MSLLNSISNRFPGLYNRKLHVYGIGAAKTGTTSLSAIFGRKFRAAHESDVQRLNHFLIRYLSGDLDYTGMKDILLERDKKLKLDVEASHPMGYLSDILVESFPRALFIITMREPYSWLRSRLNFHIKLDPSEWREYREFFWTNRQGEYDKRELLLKRYGLCSLDIYLSQYADHYQRVLASVPAKRRLIIRTDELASSLGKIANFVGVPECLLQNAHSNREAKKIEILSEMDSDFVRERIWLNCGNLIKEYFPEVLRRYEQ